MRDIEKLVETMDFFVQICQESGGYKDCLHCCQDNSKNCNYSDNADLIKLRLQAQPDAELVEKMDNETNELRGLIILLEDRQIHYANIAEDCSKRCVEGSVEAHEKYSDMAICFERIIEILQGKMETKIKQFYPFLSDVNLKKIRSLLQGKG